MISAPPATFDEPAVESTPWVLLLLGGEQERAARRVWEEAGFGVESAASIDDALECLAVMTPVLVVAEDMLYRRG